MVADIEELDTLDASEIRAQSLNAKEEMALKKRVQHLYAQWQMVQQNCFGRDYGVRESSLRQEQLVRSEDLRGVF